MAAGPPAAASPLLERNGGWGPAAAGAAADAPAKRAGEKRGAEATHGGGAGGGPLVDRVRVTVRVRPPPDDGSGAGAQVVVRADGEANQVVLKEEKQTLTGKLAHTEKAFTVDHVLGPTATQEDVYAKVGSKALDAVLRGCEACVLAYGQTGSGKTHTLLHLGSHRGFAGDVAGAKVAKNHATLTEQMLKSPKPKNTAAPAPEESPGAHDEGAPIVDDSGLLPRLATELFVRAKTDLAWRTEVRMSMVQIYSEQLVDLLQGAENQKSRRTSGGGNNTDDSRGKELKLVHRKDGGAGKARWTPEGARWVAVSSAEELIARAAEGRKRITYAETHLNKHSSRAHALLFVEVVRYGVPLDGMSDDATDTVDVVTTTGRLTIADLAGSERTKVAERGYSRDEYGKRFKEATAINTSLLALGQVVAALADSQGGLASAASAEDDEADALPSARHPHIPFRDSALTKLLEEPLSGGASVSLLACVSPLKSFAVESVNTLEFAGRAMVIETRLQQRIGTAAIDAALLQQRMTQGMENEALRRACEDLLDVRKALAMAERRVKDLEVESWQQNAAVEAARASAEAIAAETAGEYEARVTALEASLSTEKAMRETDKLSAEAGASEAADRIAELEAEIERLREELSAAFARIAQLEAAASASASELIAARTEAERLGNELSLERGKSASLDGIIQSLQGEMKGVHFMLDMEREKAAEAAESAARASAAADELLSTQTQFAELRVERVQALAQRAEHEYRLQMLSLELRLSEREGAEEALLEELRASREEAEEACSRMASEIDALSDKLAELEGQLLVEQQTWAEERSAMEGALNETHVALATTAGALAECRKESTAAYEKALDEGNALDRASTIIERERTARETAETELAAARESIESLQTLMENTLKEHDSERTSAKEVEHSLTSTETLLASYQSMVRREDRLRQGMLVMKYPGKSSAQAKGRRPQPRLVRAHCLGRGDHALPIGHGAPAPSGWWVEWTHVPRNGSNGAAPPPSAQWRGAVFASAEFDSMGELVLTGTTRSLRLAPFSGQDNAKGDLRALGHAFTADAVLGRMESRKSLRGSPRKGGSPAQDAGGGPNVRTPAEAAVVVAEAIRPDDSKTGAA